MPEVLQLTSSHNLEATAIASLEEGHPVVIVQRSGEVELSGLVCRGVEAKPASINLMAGAGHSLIMVCLRPERLAALGLPAEAPEPGPGFPAATFSIDAAKGGTGISAADRALAIATASDPDAQPDDLVMPGHVFPVAVPSRPLSSAEQDGLVEIAIEAARVATGIEAAALSPIIDPHGLPLDAAGAERFAAANDLRVLTGCA
ncbi:MAG: 3,4-dihydroxy-2-butanone-4-phosphate synthase [Solirubrobacterales bacterium]